MHQSLHRLAIDRSRHYMNGGGYHCAEASWAVLPIRSDDKLGVLTLNAMGDPRWLGDTPTTTWKAVHPPPWIPPRGRGAPRGVSNDGRGVDFDDVAAHVVHTNRALCGTLGTSWIYVLKGPCQHPSRSIDRHTASHLPVSLLPPASWPALSS